MATSENGWLVITDAGNSRLRKWKIPGTDRHLILRDGSAGFLLAHYALWYHRHIERLDVGEWDEWGWAVRPVRGKVSGYSNHASGTAMDLNATKHPLGKGGTLLFKIKGVAALARIKTRLLLYRGCIRSGAFYSGRKDEMHYEIDAPMWEVEEVARRLLGSPLGIEILKANPGARRVVLS